MKKFLITLLLILTFGIFCANAQHVLPQNELQLIADFMTYRMELTKLTPSQALASLNNREQPQMSEQGKLIINSLVEIEKYVYGIQIDSNNQLLKNKIVELSAQLESKINSMEDSKIDPWLYCVTAAMDATSMQCLTIAKSLKRGLNVKKFYLAALNKNSNLTYSLMNMGKWYFFAPAISGGSKDKALELCKKSLECAKTTGEKFYANCVLSQIYFELGKKEKCNEYLKVAEELAPGSTKISLLKILNAAGVSEFEFDADREKFNQLF